MLMLPAVLLAMGGEQLVTPLALAADLPVLRRKTHDADEAGSAGAACNGRIVLMLALAFDPPSFCGKRKCRDADDAGTDGEMQGP